MLGLAAWQVENAHLSTTKNETYLDVVRHYGHIAKVKGSSISSMTYSGVGL